MASSSRALSDDIDRLFARYLRLLNQYDALRAELGSLQSSNIARANFDAQRGVRYGRDLYDQRMQAARLCRVTASPETGTAVFSISTAAYKGKDESDHSEGTKHVQEENGPAGEMLKGEKTGIPAPKRDASIQNEKEDAGETTEEEKTRTRPRDPIRMFGILTPQALRIAQGRAVKMVEDIIPQLVSVNAEMKEVEIQIRRARKHKAKAEALKKSGQIMVIEKSRKGQVAS